MASVMAEAKDQGSALSLELVMARTLVSRWERESDSDSAQKWDAGSAVGLEFDSVAELEAMSEVGWEWESAGKLDYHSGSKWGP